MTFFVAEIVEMFQTFVWPFVRVTALMITAPIFSQRALNLRVRIVTGFVQKHLGYEDIGAVRNRHDAAWQDLLGERVFGSLAATCHNGEYCCDN